MRLPLSDSVAIELQVIDKSKQKKNRQLDGEDEQYKYSMWVRTTKRAHETIFLSSHIQCLYPPNFVI